MSLIQSCSTPSESQQEGEQPPSVLVVDDEKALRLVLCRAMEKEGYHVIEASSAERCLFLCQQQLPNMILLDAVMPGMGGFECCHRLQEMFGDRCPPILIITTLHDQESVDKAFAVGATDFITKPIHWAILRQRVQRVLKTTRLTAQWQIALMRETQLQTEIETAVQRVKRLTELCQTNGIKVHSTTMQ